MTRRGPARAAAAALVCSLFPSAVPPGVAATPPDGWRIRLEARLPGLVDKGRLTLGASSVAADGYDDYDEPHPPAWPNRSLDLVTLHEDAEPGWEGQPQPSVRYQAQYDAPLAAAPRTLEFVLETDQAGVVTLSWGMGTDLDLAQRFVTLTDVVTGATTNMWEQFEYVFTAQPGQRVFRIVLEPGRAAPPVAFDQSVTTDEDAAVPVTLTATDPQGGALSYAIVSAASHGTLLGVAPNVSYVPEPDYNGPDSFTFRARNEASGADSNVATVFVTVSPANDAPVATPQAVVTDEEQPVDVTLAGADIDGDALIFTVVTPPAHGSLSGTAPELTYTPQADYGGADNFTFRASDGLLHSAPATVSITVNSVNDPPVAAFSVTGPDRSAVAWDNNIASHNEGANVVAASSQQSTFDGGNAFHAIDDNPGTRWISAAAQVTNQWLTVELPRGPRSFDKVRLVNAGQRSGAAVRHFEIQVSTTTLEDAAFQTVLSDFALDNTRVQEFPLPAPVQARYVKLFARDNWGNATTLSVLGFEVVDTGLGGISSYLTLPSNAALLAEGAQVTAFSNQGPSTRAENLFDGNNNSFWQTQTGFNQNQFVVVQLSREKSWTIDRVRLVNFAHAAGIKDFAIDVSATLPQEGAFATVFTGTAAMNNQVQEFVFPGGAADARYVRVRALNAQGATSNTLGFAELQPVPVPAAPPSVSGYQDNRPEVVLDGDPNTAWLSAQGQVTNQHLELRVAGDEALIDRVRLQSSSGITPEAVKDFEVLLSTTSDADGAFTSVLGASYLNNGRLQEFLLPGGARRARFVKLLARNNHGSQSFLRVSTFEPVTVRSEGHVVSLPGLDQDVAGNESPAQLANGASVVRFSSASGSQTPQQMLDYSVGTPWITQGTANQSAVIALGGGRSWTLRGVQIAGRVDFSSNQSVRDFEVWVSDTTTDDAAFTLVHQGTVQNSLAVQTFSFSQVPARYVKYAPLNAHGSTTGIATSFFDVLAAEAGSVVAASSKASTSFAPEFAVDGNTNQIWLTAQGQVANQWIKLALSGGVSHRLFGVRVNSYSSLGPREIEVRVSNTTPDDGAFTTVFSGTLANTDGPKELPLGALVEAKYVEFFWKNGHGSNTQIGVRELEVLTVSPSGAMLVGFSSQSGEANNPRLALDLDSAGTWLTANNQNTNQWLKLLLPDAAIWMIDQLALQARVGCCPDQAPRDFELWASTTTANDADFSRVFAGTLRKDETLQFFSFPAVPARYVRLLIAGNYGNAQLGVQTFWVLSPQLGAPSVRFFDRSRDPDGVPATYAWSFGDGGSSTARDPAHSYAGPGTYQVTLTITDDGGAEASTTSSYRVFGAPGVDFTYAPAAPNEGQSIQFTDTTQDPLGAPVVREWDWGDGTAKVLNNPAPAKTFADNGAFPVTLRVANSRGVYASVTKTVAVANLPPTINAGPNKTVPWGQRWNDSSSATDPSIQFDAQSLQCHWDFGDGNTADVVNCNVNSVKVDHRYAAPGVYTAVLTVRDKDGGVSTDSADITVLHHVASLVVCPPQMAITRDSADVDLTAAISDTSVPGTKAAGRTVIFSVDGQAYARTTDADGVAHLHVSMAVDTSKDVSASFAGDGFYLAASGSGTAQVVRAQGATLDSQGGEFWLGFTGNYVGGGTLSLFVTGREDTTARVSIPALGFCSTVSVTHGQVRTVVLPSAAELTSADLVEAKGIHVTALKEVTVYGLNRIQFTTDAYLGLPRDILGTEYLVLGYKNFGFGMMSEFAVVASADDTSVTIQPTVAGGARPAGVPYTIQLQRGHAYQLRATGSAPADLSGTVVTADKPIAVYGGHQCANIPAGASYCDYVVEQIPPPSTWGKSFVTMPLATRTKGDSFRFLAGTDGTTVSVNGAAVATLNRGQYHELVVLGPAQIVSSQPILVAQYSNGTTFDGVVSDPFMMLVPPFEQFQSGYTVTTPATGFALNFINVVAPTSAVGTITLDGTPLAASSFVAVGASGFSGAQLTVSLGSHTLAGAAPFGVFVYGFATDDSYGYPGGMSLAPVARATSLTLEPETESSLIGVERCVTATVADQGGAPLEGVRVDFVVTGANPGTGFAATDAAGRSPLCYVGANGGVDTIVASVGTLTDSATKTWIANRAPLAQDAGLATDEDVPLPITLTATDPDGDSLSFEILSGPMNGTLSGTAPDLTYTPAPNYNGPDSLTFRANDGQADSNVATVSITVNAVNDAPVADGQALTTDEDTPLPVTLTASDIDSASLSFAVVSGPANGTLSGTAPNPTYTPNANFNGSDSFTFQANDGALDSNVATVSITVNAVNDAPVADGQSLTTDEDTPLPVTLTASDIDSASLAFVVVSGPSNGTLSGTAPDLTYTPTPNYNGPDSLTFRANDGQADSNVATVSITVNAVNDAPVAVGQSKSTAEEAPIGISLSAFDPEGSALTFAIVDQPTHGALDGSGSELTYRPAANYHGPDRFTFRANDGQADSNVAVVELTVTPVNDAPVASDGSVATDEDTPAPLALVATDVDGDPLSYTIVTQPAHGTLSGTAPALVYTPAADFNGSDVLTFRARDGAVDSGVATISITVRPVNDSPDCTAVAISATTLWPPNHKLVALGLSGATDVDGDSVTLTAVSVWQDEPVQGQGDGNTSPDAILSPLQLRSERSGQGDGRVYHVEARGVDAKGGSCTTRVRVCVPHDQSGDPAACGDGGPLHDSTRP